MSIADEIRKLEELHAAGALTDQEFSEAKQKVLSGQSHHSTNHHCDGRIHGMAEPTWCMLMHLSQLLLFAGGIGLVVPVVMWAISKDESELARIHGAHMMNWLISSFIYAVVTGILSFALVGIPFLIAVLILDIVFPIVAAVKANNGEIWRYPLSIEFLREDTPVVQ